jgi:glycerophosphoryl diester phosphodiesterase
MASRGWEYPRKIYAHRGGGTLAPENTMAAFNAGVKFGFHAVEFDVMLTMDKFPILMHDHVLQRTVDALEFHGKCVSDVLCRDILAMDAGSWKDPSFSHVRVPLCEEVFKFCMDKRIMMNIEIKPAPGFEVETGEVVGELTGRYFSQGDELMPVFSSFSFDALLAAKRVAPHIPRAYLIDSVAETPNWRQQMADLEAVSLNVDHNHLTAEIAQEIKREGYKLFCYTVNEVSRAKELFYMGIDAFCTDRLDLFRDIEF